MATYTLNSGATVSSTFTLASATTVQFSVLGDSVFGGNELLNLQVQKDDSGWANYNVSFLANDLKDVDLKANVYRVALSNATPTTDINIQVSPTS